MKNSVDLKKKITQYKTNTVRKCRLQSCLSQSGMVCLYFHNGQVTGELAGAAHVSLFSMMQMKWMTCMVMVLSAVGNPVRATCGAVQHTVQFGTALLLCLERLHTGLYFPVDLYAERRLPTHATDRIWIAMACQGGFTQLMPLLKAKLLERTITLCSVRAVQVQRLKMLRITIVFKNK